MAKRIDFLGRVHRVPRDALDLMVEIDKRHIQRLRTQVFELRRTPGKHEAGQKYSSKHQTNLSANGRTLRRFLLTVAL